MSKNIEQPIPQGKYLPAIRYQDIIYTSGMTPRKNGQLIYSGKMKGNSPIEDYRDAVRLATKNALLVTKVCLKKDEKISNVLQMAIYINAEQSFNKHSKVADYASTLLFEQLGDIGIGSRTVVGVLTLPSNALVEITLVSAVMTT